MFSAVRFSPSQWPSQHPQSAADDGGETVGDDEGEKVVADGSGADDHGAADTGEEPADGDDADAVFIKQR